MLPVILASQSPRRRQLLGMCVDSFTWQDAQVDERLPAGIAPADAVRTLALRKTLAVAKQNPNALVVGADTVVALEGRIFGKPENPAQAADFLRQLSGRVHQVYTGVALKAPGKTALFVSKTDVHFFTLTEQEIAAYLATGEPFDKAGGYGIQGRGGLLVRSIRGDYYNVVGLPVGKLQKYIKKMR